MDWKILIQFHYPHDRCLLGWEFIKPDETDDYYTIKLFVFIVTLTVDIG